MYLNSPRLNTLHPIHACRYVSNIKAGLGWLHRMEGVPLKELSLKVGLGQWLLAGWWLVVGGWWPVLFVPAFAKGPSITHCIVQSSPITCTWGFGLTDVHSGSVGPVPAVTHPLQGAGGGGEGAPLHVLAAHRAVRQMGVPELAVLDRRRYNSASLDVQLRGPYK